MKKTLFALLAVSAMLLPSCSSDEPGGINETEGNVTFTAQLPGTFSRAFADGEKATQLSYAVYETGTTAPVLSSQDPSAPQASFSGLKAQLTLNLVKGKTYDVIFWADKPGSPYTFDPATQSVSTDYSGILGNEEDRDAFFQVEKGLAVNGAIQKTITLRRPFAQINFGTNDLRQAQAVGVKVAKTSLKVNNVYSTLNLFTGVASDPVSVTYGFAELPQGEEFPVKGYDYLSMNYILTGADIDASDVHAAAKELVDCEFTVQDATGNNVNTVLLSNVPVQRNYRTNVFGSLLTSQVDYLIEVEPGFFEPAHTPVVDVTDASGFIAALNNPIAQKINVTADLDLSQATPDQLTFDYPKEINIASNATVQLGQDNRIVANNSLVLNGGGKITNTSADNSDLGRGHHKSLIHVTGGDLVIDGVTLENDPAYHYHGNGYNSAAIAYWNDVNVTITNARIISGEFTLCGMGRDVASGNVTLKDSYFESTSSSQNGTGNWAYAMRIFGNKAVLDNCEVKGTQGGVSPECKEAVINGGKYYTVNTPGKIDAFYAVYATNGCVVTINGGEFSAANDRSGGMAIGGTSCVVAGNNDTGLPVGSFVINGGKFSGKPYDSVNKTIFTPANGSNWMAIDGDTTFKWTVAE